ncbi:General transcription factor IIF subunit 1 [Trichinella nelsoni]|uniref:Transcription initiation factor IIF subunit alpha n=1 Tax=Trichinella nelsoni TaxID=6336 RepID=A0A0V0RYC8_9BILA|nr:General transcription factor IIF subunit 1 [Trichinella nelsoni]
MNRHSYLDPAQITSMTTVEREKSAEHVEADETRNSERPDSTKEVRREVRSFERGVAVAIKHDIMVNPRRCAISNYSDYWIFEKNGKIAFDIYPVGEIYNVVPVPDRKAMSIEEMEEHFKRRQVVLNQFSLRARISPIPADGNAQNNEAPNTFPDEASISQNEMVDSSPATVHAESSSTASETAEKEHESYRKKRYHETG